MCNIHQKDVMYISICIKIIYIYKYTQLHIYFSFEVSKKQNNNSYLNKIVFIQQVFVQELFKLKKIRFQRKEVRRSTGMVVFKFQQIKLNADCPSLDPRCCLCCWTTNYQQNSKAIWNQQSRGITHFWALPIIQVSSWISSIENQFLAFKGKLVH